MMPDPKTLVDKSLGTLGVVAGVAGCLVVWRGLQLLIRGPAFAHRLLGAGGVLTMPVLIIPALYIGSHLLLFPPERRCSADAVARYAARHQGLLTRNQVSAPNG